MKDNIKTQTVAEGNTPLCDHCGKVVTEGYYINGYYACIDGDCMAHVINEHEGIPLDEADAWFTQVSEIENNGHYFTCNNFLED